MEWSERSERMEWRRAFKPLFLKKIDAESD